MKFEIDWNHSGDDNILKQVASFVKEDEFSYYEVEINSPEDLQELYRRINELAGEKYKYSFIIAFDPPTIYLDDKV